MYFNYQVLQASITWKPCAALQDELSYTSATVVGGKVYCRIGRTFPPGDEYLIHCYDPVEDKCTTLPRLPVRFFGLGQVRGNLVAVGGLKEADDTVSNDVYTYDKLSQKWQKKIPCMPMARELPSILSLPSALIVAGGMTSGYTDIVEIFIPDSLQWLRTDPLPTPSSNMSLVAIDNTCYVIGGNECEDLDNVLYASIQDLFSNAVPDNQIINSGNSDAQSAWKTLPNTPSYNPTGAVLAGNLLAMGGSDTSDGETPRGTIYMLSPTTDSWMCIGDLPHHGAHYGIGVAVLSPTELLVIGGAPKVNSIYKGTLHLRL